MKYFNENMKELEGDSMVPLLRVVYDERLSMENIATPLFEDGECEIIAWRLNSINKIRETLTHRLKEVRTR